MDLTTARRCLQLTSAVISLEPDRTVILHGAEVTVEHLDQQVRNYIWQHYGLLALREIEASIE